MNYKEKLEEFPVFWEENIVRSKDARNFESRFSFAEKILEK